MILLMHYGSYDERLGRRIGSTLVDELLGGITPDRVMYALYVRMAARPAWGVACGVP